MRELRIAARLWRRALVLRIEPRTESRPVGVDRWPDFTSL